MSRLMKYDYTYNYDFEGGIDYEHYTFFVGDVEDIKTLYHSINNAWKKGNTNLYPRMVEFPVFNPHKRYALRIAWKTILPESMTFDVITADTLCQYMMIGRCLPADA